MASDSCVQSKTITTEVDVCGKFLFWALGPALLFVGCRE